LTTSTYRCQSPGVVISKTTSIHGDIVLGFILYLLLIGVAAGFIARALVPGPDPMSVPATIALGVVGSFIGGFLGWALFGTDLEDGALQASGVIGSIVGAVIALLAYRALMSRSTTRVGRRN
jgi:uncharacterized membrane protein YeaQ/YmgE (transglycosylase-associated protein family)